MGILHSREELIPVTCAVISDEARREFFAQVRRKAGKTERIAQACAVAPGVVADWMSGKSLIPYHALMRLAQEFEIQAPQVSELRREYQPVVQLMPPRRGAAPPPPTHPSQTRPQERAPREPRADRARPPRQGSGQAPRGVEGRREQPRREARPPQAQKGVSGHASGGSEGPVQNKSEGRRGRPRRERRPKASTPKAERPRQERTSEKKTSSRSEAKIPSGKTKYSDRLAYWTGALLATGKRADDGLRLEADRVIGQNFAATWAKLTEQLFEVKPQLSMSGDHRCQVAFLPNEAFKDFEIRVELRLGTAAPAAPRWTWSNPDWKAAFLRGLMDACAHFHRTPSLNLRGLSEPLRASAQKILVSLAYTATQKEDGTLLLEGADLLEKYFAAVGTENLKLRDQFNAWKRSHGEGPRPEGRGRRGARPRPQAMSSAEMTAVSPETPQAPPDTPEWTPPALEQPFVEPTLPFPQSLPDADATQDDSY